MGSASSSYRETPIKPPKPSKPVLKKSVAEVVKLMMPVYYSTEDLSIEERQVARSTWDLIVNDQTPEFLASHGKEDFPYLSCVSFFYDSFYTRLFDIHPSSRELFMTGMKSQGKFLVKLIGVALSETENEDPQVFDKTMFHLAKVHFDRGVKAVEYGIVGEVLFWTMRRVMGHNAYTDKVHTVWVKIYNRMLRTIIPVAIKLEMQSRGDGSSKSSGRSYNSSFIVVEQPQQHHPTESRQNYSSNNNSNSNVKVAAIGEKLSTHSMDNKNKINLCIGSDDTAMDVDIAVEDEGVVDAEKKSKHDVVGDGITIDVAAAAAAAATASLVPAIPLFQATKRNSSSNIYHFGCVSVMQIEEENAVLEKVKRDSFVSEKTYEKTVDLSTYEC